MRRQTQHCLGVKLLHSHNLLLTACLSPLPSCLLFSLVLFVSVFTTVRTSTGTYRTAHAYRLTINVLCYPPNIPYSAHAERNSKSPTENSLFGNLQCKKLQKVTRWLNRLRSERGGILQMIFSLFVVKVIWCINLWFTRPGRGADKYTGFRIPELSSHFSPFLEICTFALRTSRACTNPWVYQLCVYTCT